MGSGVHENTSPVPAPVISNYFIRNWPMAGICRKRTVLPTKLTVIDLKQTYHQQIQIRLDN
jgi:hypothetical protein